VRRLALAIAAMLVAGFAGAERTSGVFIFTAPDGSRRIVNVPASGPGTIAIPEGAADHRAALWPAVEEAARSHGLDPRLVDLVIRMESGYNPRAVSPKGARGVMQLMPATAASLGVTNAYDPEQNIPAGVSFLGSLLNTYGGDQAAALAAYNWGPANVNKAQATYGSNWLSYAPASVQSYVNGILGSTAAAEPVTVDNSDSTDVSLGDFTGDTGTSDWIIGGVALAALVAAWWVLS